MLKTFSKLRRTAALATAATLIFGFAAPVQADDKAEANSSSSSSPQGDATTARPAREKKYCFLVEVTGSRLRDKICKTRAEWEAEGQPLEMR